LAVRNLILALALSAAAPSTAVAGAWTQPAGDHYAKTWARAIVGSNVFLPDGSVEPLGADFIDVSLNLYLEYGLSDDVTVVVSGNPMGFAKVGDESAAYTGQFRFAGRYGLIRGPVRLAAELFYGVAPGIGQAPLFSGVIKGHPVTYIPSIANHAGGGELSLGWGHPWGWLAATGGVEFNGSDELDHALYGFAQVGFSFGFGLYFDIHVTYRKNLGEIEVANVSGVGPTNYLGLGLGVGFWVTDDVGINLGFDTAPMAESNAGAPSLTLGIEFR